MKKWKKQFSADLATLRQETKQGAPFKVCVLPSEYMESCVAAGNEGDKDARQIIMSICQWFKTADAAARDKHYPYCVSCDLELKPGDVFGFVVFTPLEPATMGMVGVFCEDCHGLGEQKLIDNMMKHLGQVHSQH